MFAFDLSHAGGGLRLSDLDLAGREVYVAPVQCCELSDSRPGEYERREERASIHEPAPLFELRSAISGLTCCAPPILGKPKQLGDALYVVTEHGERVACIEKAGGLLDYPVSDDAERQRHATIGRWGDGSGGPGPVHDVSLTVRTMHAISATAARAYMFPRGSVR